MCNGALTSAPQTRLESLGYLRRGRRIRRLEPALTPAEEDRTASPDLSQRSHLVLVLDVVLDVVLDHQCLNPGIIVGPRVDGAWRQLRVDSDGRGGEGSA
ncbi:uncharacterized protein V6R79_017304 [Siganus canaliculatus]